MKTLTMSLKKILICASLIIGIQMMIGAGLLFAYSDDRAERLSQESSYTFSPGYVNAAFQQARAVLRQTNPDNNKQGLLDRSIEYAKDKLEFLPGERCPQMKKKIF